MLGGLLQERGRCGGRAWSEPAGHCGDTDGPAGPCCEGLQWLRRGLAFIPRTGKRAQCGRTKLPSSIRNFKNSS